MSYKARMKLHMDGKYGVGKVVIIDQDDYDKISGISWHITKRGYVAYNKYLGGGKKSPKYKRIFLHHLIIGRKDNMTVDHKDGNRLNNRKSNLRFCTQQEQSFNRKITKSNTSGYKGVDRYGDKWRVRLELNNKKIKIGVFLTKQEAAKAYNKAAKKYFGEFARLNIL